MFVYTTMPGNFGSPSGTAFAAFQVREVPREYYDEQVMTRLGPNLSSAQQAALIPWSSVSPGWPFPINAE